MISAGAAGERKGHTMAYKVESMEVWSGTLEDEPGSLARKLAPLSAAGINLEFVLARRDKPGSGLWFAAPIKGVNGARTAKAVGLKKDALLGALRIIGPDKKGLGQEITEALANARINLRAVSAATVGGTSVLWFAFDGKKDSGKARQILRRILAR